MDNDGKAKCHVLKENTVKILDIGLVLFVLACLWAIKAKKITWPMSSDFACLVNKMTINDNLTNKNAITCLEVAGDCDLRTFAPKNFPRTDFFKTLTAGRK